MRGPAARSAYVVAGFSAVRCTSRRAATGTHASTSCAPCFAPWPASKRASPSTTASPWVGAVVSTRALQLTFTTRADEVDVFLAGDFNFNAGRKSIEEQRIEPSYIGSARARRWHCRRSSCGSLTLRACAQTSGVRCITHAARADAPAAPAELPALARNRTFLLAQQLSPARRAPSSAAKLAMRPLLPLEGRLARRSGPSRQTTQSHSAAPRLRMASKRGTRAPAMALRSRLPTCLLARWARAITHASIAFSTAAGMMGRSNE